MKQPLFGMELMIVGETSTPKDELEHKIKQMGGKVVETIHENVTAIISNAEEVTKMGPTMEMAKTHGIHVVPDTFIANIKNADLFELLAKHDLSGWGQNVCILLLMNISVAEIYFMLF